ncbi:hypothetical protein L195_g020623 [Trifolium pratense]|uniref:Uncharacterized protein n=1 Tax=Trifolium pratense TaxID=57577 RepID=A0A2K3N314_TRIPR|nr:hypothetical protein L195_g020623 [Trifolium pratense]
MVSMAVVVGARSRTETLRSLPELGYVIYELNGWFGFLSSGFVCDTFNQAFVMEQKAEVEAVFDKTLHDWPPCFCVSKIKPLRISGFKGIAHNDDSRTRASWLKAPKTSVGLEDSGETHNVSFSYASEAGNNLETSSAFHGLFKKWLKMLRTQSSCQEVEGFFGKLTPTVSPEILPMSRGKETSEVLKVAWSYFLALDATIKIPLLIFVPLYLAVNLKYGAEVSKELTPLWVFGPLILAIHIMIIRGSIGSIRHSVSPVLPGLSAYMMNFVPSIIICLTWEKYS